MKQKTEISFWGVRGSHPVSRKNTLRYGGNTSCIAFRHKKQWLICDAGTGIIPLGKKLAKKKDDIAVLWTHLHWDHLLGLPFFAPLQEKKRKITLLGSRLIDRVLRPPFFPITLKQFPATLVREETGPDWTRVGEIWFHHFPVKHSPGTVGFRFTLPSGKQVVHVADGAHSLANRDMLRRIEGIDLLIHDAQYSRAEYGVCKGFGHSCFLDVVVMAIEARAKHLILFHHSPAASDKELEKRLRQARQLIRKKKSPLRCDLAQEGMVLSL